MWYKKSKFRYIRKKKSEGGGGEVGRVRDAPLRPPGIELLPVNSNSDALLH